MADKKISELVELTTPSATDKLPIVDGSETKYIEYQNLVPTQATDLSYTASPTNGTVVSSTGTDATIPLATNTNAGLLTPAEKTVIGNTSNTNTGDETQSTIETKLGFASVTALTIAFYNATKNLISATGSNLGTFFQTFTSKSTPIDADTIIVNDSASSFEAKKTTLTQFKAFLKTYFDTQYGSAFSGTVNKIPRFTSSNTIGDSSIQINDVGTPTEYIYNTKRTYILNSVNDALPALQVIKNQTGSVYDLLELSSSSGGVNESVNSGSNHNSFGKKYVNNSSISYNQWIQTFDKTISERNGTAVNNANIVFIRDGRAVTATAPPDGYGIGHYYLLLGSSNNIYQKYLGFYACNLNVGAGTYGFRWMDEDSTGGGAGVRRELANLNQDGTLTLNPKVVGVGNGFVTSNGAKVGNNTDTAIVAGAGAYKYSNGRLSFSNGANWGDIENDRNIVTPISTYTILSTDHILLNNQSSSWTLPSNTSLVGKKYLIYLNNNTLTLNSDGVDLLNGAFFIIFSASYKAIEVRCLASGVWLTNMV